MKSVVVTEVPFFLVASMNSRSDSKSSLVTMSLPAACADVKRRSRPTGSRAASPPVRKRSKSCLAVFTSTPCCFAARSSGHAVLTNSPSSFSSLAIKTDRTIASAFSRLIDWPRQRTGRSSAVYTRGGGGDWAAAATRASAAPSSSAASGAAAASAAVAGP